MRRLKIKVRKYSDESRPNLRFVVGYREAGARKRRFFEAKEPANAFAAFKNAELARNGVEGAEFPTALRVMAQNAVEALKPFPGETITDAIQHYVAHLKAIKQSIEVAALMDAVIAEKKKACGKKQRPASPDYIVDLTVRLGRFNKAFGKRLVATITKQEIEKWLKELKDEKQGENLSPQSRGNYARALGVAFSYAVECGYAPGNPIKEIKKPTGDSKPEILSVEQTARLLESASPEILPYIAIGAFAGLRASELERLDWRDIDFEENEIAVNSESKTGERHVDVLPNLREWLLPLRKHTGKITPENFRRHFDEAREAAGVLPWPSNALRHSFGSYHLKHFGNDAQTRLQMGHWRDSTVLFANYRRAVTRGNAERYWTIRPAKASKKIVQLVAQH